MNYCEQVQLVLRSEEYSCKRAARNRLVLVPGEADGIKVSLDAHFYYYWERRFRLNVRQRNLPSFGTWSAQIL